MPCFNEAGKIGDLLAAMPASIGEHKLTVLVVDDGSTDSSVAEVREQAQRSADTGSAEIRLLQLPKNLGKGAALRRAHDEIRGDALDAVIWMDSDGQHCPESLADLVRPVISGEIDLCVGSRYLNGGHSGRVPLNRRIVRFSVVRAVCKITGFAVTDPFSGFRCFSPLAIGTLKLDGDGYEAELESCFSVARVGLAFAEVPIPRIYGSATSKMGYHHGALRGRFAVVSGYVRTISGALQQLQTQVPLPAHG